ncbi:MAG: aspartate aminotransferase family protein [Devosia sp.]|uniref:pyridoxal phosphate-dependent decarboxylase family protein n=1 Tax=Devosia sp. TaxID=1871048 RepID=UPI00261FCEAE|nr:aminotransferase class V-fold PLP-dependent enzyme [Devosia sp.]MDB5541911.1 aspartate aminotransferase family protein [Devosia sp.]
MTDDLRRLLTRAVDHAVDYRDSLAEHAGRPARTYYEMRDALSEPLPERGAAPLTVLEELAERSAGGLMPITGPRFFGWVMGASHPAGVAADWLVSAWGQNAGYHTPTPAASAMEEIAERWLLDILDLPRESSIGFVTGATVAGAVGLAAARTRVLLDAGWDPDADGLFGAPPVHVLIGEDAHSSMFSALQLIGFGYRRVIRVGTDGEGRMRPDALTTALRGLTGPRIVIAQAGQINTGAYDPFTEIIAIAKAAGAWVHVDGAFGLWARAAPSLKHLTAGIEGADSWVTDGHKWLQVPYDSGFAIVRDREAHQRAMTQWASYLPSIGETDRVPSAFVPELSRRARGTPVWAMLKTFGREGVAALVEHHCALAKRMAARLTAEPGINLRNEVTINQLIVDFGKGDAATRKTLTEAVIAGVQAGGICFAGGASWRGDWVMRLSISSGATTEADIDMSADAIIAAWREVQAQRPADAYSRAGSG